MKNFFQLSFPNGSKKEIPLPIPPKSLDEFRVSCLKNRFQHDKIEIAGFYPCEYCGGLGLIWDPNDPPDPIEGNKLRNRIKCPFCSGTGQVSKKEFQIRYRAHKEAVGKCRAETLVRLKKTQDALNKLSPEEYSLVLASR